MARLLFALFALLLNPAFAQTNLTWWTTWSAEADTQAWGDALVEAFEAEHPDVTVERVDYAGDDLKVAIQAALAAGAPPDVWHSWGGGVLGSFVQEGVVYDMSELLGNLQSDGLVGDGVLSAATFDGTPYCLPYEVFAAPMFVNADLFEQVGLEIPDPMQGETWTWEEFMSAVQTFEEAGVQPLTVGGQGNWQLSFYYMYLVDRFGGSDAFAEALSREGSFTAPAFVQAGEYAQDLVEMDAFQRGFLGADYDVGQRPFFTGEAAMYVMGSWMVGGLREFAPDFNLAFINFPTLPDGEGDPGVMVGATQTYYCVSEASQQKEAALDLVRFLARPENVRGYVEATGRLAALNVDVPEGTYDPVVVDLLERISSAPYLQIAYDQGAPPQLATEHIELMGQLFAERMTPEEVATRHETVAEQLESSGELP